MQSAGSLKQPKMIERLPALPPNLPLFWVLGILQLYAGLLAYLALLSHVRRLWKQTAADNRPWWLGYLRDSINLLFLANFALAYLLIGLPLPLALLLGFGYALFSYLADYLVNVSFTVHRK